ncbi:dihydrolipoyl dehydrogenase family protein [Pikeienuella sp. HZG-20]|uniref:dihydrolipoyl dehydrogenase family protein n=1 Tax=Paludibacillus litoralis TaxID=3133267 RepID=UPI0030ECEFAA
MEILKPDLCVIGGGSAGLSVAAGAVQMGASVVLIEGDEMGGDCLNTGCVPSKALLAAGKAAHAMTAGGAFGVRPVTPEIDFAAAKAHVRAVIEGIAPQDSVARFEGLGVTVIQAMARFVSPDEVIADGRRIRARRFVIATGSRPTAPPIPGLESVGFLTNETIFGLSERPRRLLIIGGGPIGCEMAQAHRRLGSEVVVLEAAAALGREDPELAAIALKALRAEGIVIRDNVKIASARRAGDEIALTLEDGEEISGDALLVAAGRRANIDDLGLADAKIETTKTGVKVDKGLRATNRRVYAIGDAAGGLQFTHLAAYHAGLVLRSALFRLPAKVRDDHIPRVTYLDPELAQVGLTEAEARAQHGDKLEVHRAEYAENDRARADNRTTGFTKVMIVKGRPVGASIVGAQAGDLIAIWALALSSRLKIADVANFIAPYPTYGELAKRAAGAYFTPRLFESALVKRAVRLLAKLG